MSNLIQSFSDEYDEQDGIAWGQEVLSSRGRCGAAGRWGTPADILAAQAEHATMMILIEQRQRRLV